MATKTETVTLLGDTYRITQLGAEVGSDLWDDILASVGSSLLAKLEGLQAKLAGANIKDEATLLTAVGPVVLSVLAGVPKDLKKRWRKLFLANTVLVTSAAELNMAKAELFDQHFAGRYDAMTAWEAACIRHNFLNFLGSKSKPGDSAPNVAT